MDKINLWVLKLFLRLRRFLNELKHPGIEAQREEFESAACVFKVAEDVETETIEISHLLAEWIQIQGQNPRKFILYLHGGGYTLGSIKTHRELVSRIARAAHAKALLLDYRLAPEHPFPAALEDSLMAYRYLLEQGISPKSIIIMGDSAGGGLAMSTLLSLRDKGEPLPAAGVFLSPWVDLVGTGESLKKKSGIDPMLNPQIIHSMARLYMGNQDPSNPLVSSIHANLTGLPPLLIQVGTNEILYDDSVRLAEKAKECKVPVELDIWERMTHVWHFFAMLLPQAQQAVEKIAQFIEKQIV